VPQLDGYMRANLKAKQLQLLVALDDFRNVSRAAAQANITQPAVSKALGELERGLGLKLFQRTAHGINPTVYGECMVRHARTMLEELTHAREELRGLQAGTSGKLNVGALSATVQTLLPRSLALFKQRSPGTGILLREGTLEVLLPELWLSKLDLIVGRLPHERWGRNLAHKALSEEPVRIVTGAQHPLTRRKRLAWSDLRNFPWILPPPGSLMREPVEQAFERHAIPLPSGHIETISVHVIGGYLPISDAIAVMAGDVARYYQKLGIMAILPLEFPKLAPPIGVTWSRERPLSPAAKLMIECLGDATESRQAGPKRHVPGTGKSRPGIESDRNTLESHARGILAD
jgi:DNA-binding transcriptional LysR family regulator